MQIKSKFSNARETAAFLNISERQLLRLRKAAILQPGIHFVRKFPKNNASLLYDLDLCEKAIRDASSDRNVQTLERAES